MGPRPPAAEFRGRSGLRRAHHAPASPLPDLTQPAVGSAARTHARLGQMAEPDGSGAAKGTRTPRRIEMASIDTIVRARLVSRWLAGSPAAVALLVLAAACSSSSSNSTSDSGAP